jgi:hypothetical protein
VSDAQHEPEGAAAAAPFGVASARLAMEVVINGTDTNRWHAYGLTCNPFPQLGRAEFAAGERQIASLDGDPVRGPEDIRERLAGFAPAFIEGVIERWQPGERVAFLITFPDR